MGADAPKVALAQLSRYILGVGVFPPMICAYDNVRGKREARKKTGTSEATMDTTGTGSPGSNIQRVRSKVQSPLAFVCTMAVGLGAGLLGQWSRIPAGTFLFALVAVLVLRLCFDFAYLPPWVKKNALLVSGCYIGSTITFNDVLGFKYLALPIAIILTGYIMNCFITGKIISITCGFNRKEGMLITTPAGASDIALSAADIGVENTSIIIIQVFRASIAMALFPQIITILVFIFG
jgi:membrane AbrB-like protein